MKDINAILDKIVKIYSKVGCRHIQTLLIFLCMIVCFMMRIDMSIAIVAMTTCDTLNTTDSSIQTSQYIYSWDKQTQDIILSSFLWGYTIAQIPAGRCSERFGAKPLLILTLIVNGFVTLMLPGAVYLGDWQGACICRILQGITQSCIYPALNTFGSQWFPLSERSRLYGLVSSGSSLGTILGIMISSNIAVEFGWPSVFYTLGSLGIIVGVIFCFFASNSPSSHKTITEKEKYYIENSGCANKSEQLDIPWKSILTSVPYLAIIVAQIGSDFGHVMFFMEIPSYMNKVLNIRIRENGFFSALPYMAAWINTIAMSILSDYLLNRKIIKRGVSRKMFNTLGTWIPAALVIGFSFVSTSNPYLVIALLTLGVGFTTSVTMGYGLSSLDIAPNFSGILVGISNFVSQCFCIMAPISVGLILKDDSDPNEWQKIFFITAGIYFVANSVYLLCGSSQLQLWNDKRLSEKNSEDTVENNCSSSAPSIIIEKK